MAYEKDWPRLVRGSGACEGGNGFDKDGDICFALSDNKISAWLLSATCKNGDKRAESFAGKSGACKS
jgi:hypothetical protein